MEYHLRADDRAAFKRCRRQWDFASTTRRGLQPNRPLGPSLDQTMRDTLAVYYFPGMWDWDSAIVLPLVVKALDRSLDRQRAANGDDAPAADAGNATGEMRDRAYALLERYVRWAPTVDVFSPVRVETDFDALVPDLADPERGLVTPAGEAVHYLGRIDLLAMDEHDRYWVVRHRVVDGPFPPTEQLMLDEEQVAACWGWGHFYDGMEVSGTIYNELNTAAADVTVEGGTAAAGRPVPLPRPFAEHPRGGIPQHEPSGGGRGVSSPRRMYVPGREEENYARVRQVEAPGFRRTIVRRSRREIADAGRRVAAEAVDMTSADLCTYPSPALERCVPCAFVAPCLALSQGRDAEAILRERYHPAPAEDLSAGRLGGSPYGVGRGWVPPTASR